MDAREIRIKSEVRAPKKVGTCPWCKEVAPITDDHIVPLSRGGRRQMYGDTKNIRRICNRCNSMLTSGLMGCFVPIILARYTSEELRVTPKLVLMAWGFIHIRKKLRNKVRGSTSRDIYRQIRARIDRPVVALRSRRDDARMGG